MMKDEENNGMEEIVLVTPIPGQWGWGNPSYELNCYRKHEIFICIFHDYSTLWSHVWLKPFLLYIYY